MMQGTCGAAPISVTLTFSEKMERKMEKDRDKNVSLTFRQQEVLHLLRIAIGISTPPGLPANRAQS